MSRTAITILVLAAVAVGLWFLFRKYKAVVVRNEEEAAETLRQQELATRDPNAGIRYVTVRGQRFPVSDNLQPYNP